MYRFVPMEDSLQREVSAKSESSSMFRRLNAVTTTIPHVTSTPSLNYVLTNEPTKMQKCHGTAKPTTTFGPLKHLHDFTPKVSSFNLNLLFMGDTVGSQYYEWMSKVMVDSNGDSFGPYGPRVYDGRRLTAGSFKFENGGVISFFRNNGLLNRDFSDNSPFTKQGQLDETVVANMIKVVGKYDVMVHRTPWPLLPGFLVGNMNEAIYTRILETAHEYFGVKTIIFMTSKHNHNAYGRVETMRKDNDVIRKFVQDYQPPADGSGVQHVLLLDEDRYANLLLMVNGMKMGLEPEEIFTNSLTKMPWNIRPTQSMVCDGDFTSPQSSEVCEQGHSSLSYDGTMWCNEVGVRSSSAILCLMSCIYNPNDNHIAFPVSKADQGYCQKKCNDQFMGLNEIKFE